MKHRKKLFALVILFFSLASFSSGEDNQLQYFLFKTSSQTTRLSEKESIGLLNCINEMMQRVQQVYMKLLQSIQTGAVDIRYQEGTFWMSKLKEDQETIENGIEQIKLLREKSTNLVASVKLYKSLRDISSSFNVYNNLPSFSAIIGDLAPEMELWTDPIFYKLYLLPLTLLKDLGKDLPQKTEKVPPQKAKEPVHKVKKP